MQFKLTCFILIICCIFSCKEKPISQTELIERELNALTTNDLKRAWLEAISAEDQKMRQGQSAEIMLKHGSKSKEMRIYTDSMNALDELNLLKIESYLKKYGHPKKSELGKRVVEVPWMVIHHANTYDDRERNFGVIYQAFLDGEIDDGALAFYLGRMFQMKNGYRFEMKSPYKGIDEINQLIEKLGLETPKSKE